MPTLCWGALGPTKRSDRTLVRFLTYATLASMDGAYTPLVSLPLTFAHLQKELGLTSFLLPSQILPCRQETTLDSGRKKNH
jgi:hypothetical protein